MTRRAIVLFTGDPRREEMQKSLPARFLSALHGELIETIRRTPDVSLVIASESAGRFHLAYGDRQASVVSDLLGEKIDCAYRFAFELGFDSVVLLAGDVAGVELDVIDRAFATLEGTDERSVLGPSRDGGFYLLGLNRVAASRAAIDWNSIPWFTASSSEALASVVRALGWQLSFVRQIDDIDSFSDAVRVTGNLSLQFAKLRSRLHSLLSDRSFALDSLDLVPPAHLFEIALLRAPPLF